MKKRFLFLLFFSICLFFCFAEETKYRYVFFTNSAIMIADMAVEIPKEKLNDKIIPMNTSTERLAAEGGFRNMKYLFYDDEAAFYYADYTKDHKNPDIKYIYTWDELMAYVRGED